MGDLDAVDARDVHHTELAGERRDGRVDDVLHDVVDAHRIGLGQALDGVQELELVGQPLRRRHPLDRSGGGVCGGDQLVRRCGEIPGARGSEQHEHVGRDRHECCLALVVRTEDPRRLAGTNRDRRFSGDGLPRDVLLRQIRSTFPAHPSPRPRPPTWTNDRRSCAGRRRRRTRRLRRLPGRPLPSRPLRPRWAGLRCPPYIAIGCSAAGLSPSSRVG